MSNDYVLMKGNEAIAEAALRAGCRFYAGYPITPQSEILEYMSANMAKWGGTFYQAENEIASMSMIYGAASAGARVMSSSSGPGFDLKQEEISYMSANWIPAVIVNAMRYGTGDGEITAGQDSYWLTTRGGGHGDSRQIVLAPASVNECAQLSYDAFDLADKYRNVVLILTDGAVSQMIEKCTLPEPKEHDIDQFDYTLTGKPLGAKKNKICNMTYSVSHAEYNKMQMAKYKAMVENEQRWESIEVDDAEIVLVAYGISSRVCKTAVREARQAGIKLGLIRPITVWPFPRKAFEALPDTVKAYVTVEMTIATQLGLDVELASKRNHPMYSYCTGVEIPTTDGVIDFCKDVLAGKIQPTEVY